MKTKLNLLMLEDDEADAELIKRFLERSGMAFNFSFATSKKEFIAAIEEQDFDVVLADNSLPQFNSVEALKIVQDKNTDTPFILVTGTVSEEFAVAIIQRGADDYILKNNLTRLPSAINRAIERHEMQREKMKAEEQLKQSHEELRQLGFHLQEIREEERASMAREIHDELGQLLTGLKMDISWLTKKLTDKEDLVQNKLVSIHALLDETIVKVRKLATELRPSILDDVGLAEAMEWQSTEFEKRSGIEVTFHSIELAVAVPSNIAIGLFRIYQESLTNVARHAEAGIVSAGLHQNGKELELTITDNGKGFDTASIGHKKTLGLLGMKERTLMMGGKYNIISCPGRGTTVSVTIPI